MVNLKRKLRSLPFLVWLLILIPTSLLVSCKKVQLSKLATNPLAPTLAIPIGFTEFNVYQVLSSSDTNSLVVVDTDGSLKLVYDSERELLSAEELVNIQDQSYTFEQTAAGSGIPPTPSFNGSATIPVNELISFNSSGAELTSIEFLQGLLNLQASTTLMHNVIFDLTFPDLTVNGTPVNININLNQPMSVPQTANASRNLSNALLDLDNYGQGNNQFRITGSVTINGTGNPILGIENVRFVADMNGLEFNLVRGNFGTQSVIDLMDTIDIRIFKNFVGGTIQFNNPQIKFTAMNSFGIPMEINFNDIKTIEDNTGNENDLIGFPIQFPISAPASPGVTSTSTVIMDETNTNNISSIVTPAPKRLVYDLSGSINPQGQTNNFIRRDSKLILRAELDLPLEGYATGFQLKDTMNYTLQLPDQLEFLEFRLIADNGFPAEVRAQIIAVDSDFNVLEDITQGIVPIIPGAPVNASTGKVTQPVQKTTDFRLDIERAARLASAKYLIVMVDGQTTNANNGQVVKFYDSYKLGIKLGAKFKLRD